MADRVTQLILEILLTEQPESYLEAQNRALQPLRRQYRRLLKTARDHPEPAVRSEALHLVMLLSEPDHRIVLDQARSLDPDPLVRGHAEGLLFQSIAAEKVMTSDQFDGEQLRAYLRSVRRQMAEVRFGIAKPKAKAKSGVAEKPRRARGEASRTLRKRGGR